MKKGLWILFLALFLALLSGGAAAAEEGPYRLIAPDVISFSGYGYLTLERVGSQPVDGYFIESVTSDRPDIIRVHSSYLIQGVGWGDATITVRFTNSYTLSKKIHVYNVPSSITVLPDKAVLDELETLQLHATMTSDGDGWITYSSSNTDIATVDENGLVKALKYGTATIYAKATSTYYGAYPRGECQITVRDTGTSPELEPSEITIRKGETVQFTARTRNGDPCNVTYDVGSYGAEISPDGLFRTVNERAYPTYLITATDEHGRKASAKVNIKPSKIIGISAGWRPYVPGEVGSVVVDFDVYASPTIHYFSTNPFVLDFLNETDSRFTCLTSGTARIIVVTEDGMTGYVDVTVEPYAGLYADEEIVFLGAGQTRKLDVRDAKTGKAVSCKFTSENPKVAKVDRSSGKVTAVSSTVDDGLTVIYAEASGQRIMWFYVFVLDKPTSASFESPTLYLNIGESKQTNLLIEPPTSYDDRPKYTSSNTKIATVSADGVVKAVQKGTVTIQAELYNGVKAKCTVVVGVEPTMVHIFAPNLTLGVGQVYSLAATPPAFNEGAASEYSYSSSDPSVFTVQGETIHAINVGTATLTVTTKNGKQDHCTIQVLPAPSDLTVSDRDIRLAVGEKHTFDVSIPGGTYGLISARVQDASIAKLEGGRTVTALKPGITTLTFETLNGVRVDCTVTVVAGPTSVAFASKTVSMGVGTTYQLAWSFGGNPTTAIGFSSANAKIITVDANGLVTAHKTGKAKVTLTANGKKATCEIVVVNPVTSISVTGGTALNAGASTRLKASVAPSNATNKKLKWTSSDSSVATVNSKGEVKAKAVGGVKQVVITASTLDGSNLSFDHVMTIYPVPQNVRLTYEGTAVTTLNIDLSKTTSVALAASVSPSDPNQLVTFTSSDKKVATVDANGVVSFKKAGKVTISATTQNKKKASVKITASLSVEQITLSGGNQLLAGKRMKLSVAVSPQAATNKKVTWTSSNADAATVNSKGEVTAKDVAALTGVVITAHATDGSGVVGEHLLTIVPRVRQIGISDGTGVISALTVDLTTATTITLIAEVNPTDANQAVSWSSSDKKTATVDANGVVQLHKKGSVTITATSASDSGKKAKVVLTIIQTPASEKGAESEPPQEVPVEADVPQPEEVEETILPGEEMP